MHSCYIHTDITFRTGMSFKSLYLHVYVCCKKQDCKQESIRKNIDLESRCTLKIDNTMIVLLSPHLIFCFSLILSDKPEVKIVVEFPQGLTREGENLELTCQAKGKPQYDTHTHIHLTN